MVDLFIFILKFVNFMSDFLLFILISVGSSLRWFLYEGRSSMNFTRPFFENQPWYQFETLWNENLNDFTQFYYNMPCCKYYQANVIAKNREQLNRTLRKFPLFGKGFQFWNFLTVSSFLGLGKSLKPSCTPLWSGYRPIWLTFQPI